MLILGRKIGETVFINNGVDEVVTITVLRVDRGQVKLGINAPANTQVDREEIYLKKQAENKTR